MLQSIISQSVSDKRTFESYNSFYYDSQLSLAALKPVDPFFTYGIVYSSVDGYWYIGAMSAGGFPYHRESLIYKMDSSLNIVQTYQIPNESPNTSNYDSHLKPVIEIDDLGHLYILREVGKNSGGLSGGHNTDYLLYKTTTVGDLSTIALLKRVDGFYSYPLLSVKGSNIFLFARGNANNTSLDELNIQISTDSGATFTGHTVFNTELNTNARAYCQRVHDEDSNNLYLVHNPRKDSLGVFNEVFVMKSLDNGVTWGDMDETFTKNITTTGAIDRDELDDELLLWAAGSDDYAINSEGGVFKDGVFKLLLTRSDRHPGLPDAHSTQTYETLRLYTHKLGVGWSFLDLSEILPAYTHIWALEKTVQFCWDDTYDYIYILDKTVSPNILYEYKSADSFQNYTYNIVDQLNDNYFFGSHSVKSSTNNQRLLAMFEIEGVMTDIDSTANLKFYNPE